MVSLLNSLCSVRNYLCYSPLRKPIRPCFGFREITAFDPNPIRRLDQTPPKLIFRSFQSSSNDSEKKRQYTFKRNLPPLLDSPSKNHLHPSLPFALIGGLLLAAYMLKNNENSQESAASEEDASLNQSPENSRSSETNGYRIGSLDDLRPNDPIKDLTTLGLSEDLHPEYKGKGYYKIKDTNPFRAKLVNGQLIWVSLDKVAAEHIRDIKDFYVRHKRTLLVNTGIHGDPTGKVIVDGKVGVL